MKHLAVASRSCVAALLRRTDLPGLTSIFLRFSPHYLEDIVLLLSRESRTWGFTSFPQVYLSLGSIAEVQVPFK